MKNFETFFTLCSPEDEGQTGSGAYSGDVGEGENDTPDVEYVDPLDDADGNLDKEETNGTVITDNGEMETVVEGTGDANPIDPVEVVTTPTEPNNENPDDNPEDDLDFTYVPELGMNENGNYSGEGEGNIEEEEQDDESSIEDNNEDDISLEEYAAKYPCVQFDENLSQKEMLEFYKAFATMPSVFRSMEITVRFDKTITEAGNCVRETVTFRDIEAMKNSIFEELFHAYQSNIKGWNLMCDTRAESEFEAKMTQAMLDYTTKGGFLGDFSTCDQPYTREDGSQGSVLYDFFQACFSDAYYLSDEFKNDAWQFFDEDVFLAGFEEIFNIWHNNSGEYQKYPINEDYDWSYWSDWFDILRLYY